MSNGKKFAFLGKSFSRYIAFIVVTTIVLIGEKIINYNYIIVQKEVQSGAVSENWQSFMNLSMAAAIVSLLLWVMKVFLSLWIEKVQKPNFFVECNGLIQEEKLQAALKLLVEASAKVYAGITVIETLINSVYIIIIMGVISMTVPAYIGAVTILLSGIVFGIYRGKLQAKTDLLGAEVQSLQQILSNYFMISLNVLNEHLKEVKANYWKRIGLQCLKNAIQMLPDAIKVIAFVGLFYNITMTGMAEGEIYPYTFIVMTAYGYIVSVAGNISNLLEYLSKINLYKNDIELKEFKEEIEKRRREIEKNSKSVRYTETGVVLEPIFTVPVTRPNGETAFYKVPKALVIRKGNLILLEGENGTGKSRLCKLVKAILGAIGYDAKTGMVEQLYKNFVRGKESIDFNLIKHLAKGVGLERIPESKNEFFQMKCSAINSADRQMLAALQILYFAIKEHEEENKRNLIILDEIFANLSDERTKKVLPFIANELAKIGACTIVVSHSHKEEIKKYASAIWQMRNEANEVIIEERPVY